MGSAIVAFPTPSHCSAKGAKRSDEGNDDLRKMWAGTVKLSWLGGTPRGNSKENIFLNFKDFGNFGKILRISTRIFRRNLDTMTFPKFF
jgi:hypothetical protein